VSLACHTIGGALIPTSQSPRASGDIGETLPDGVLRGCLCPLYAFTRHSLSATLTAALSFPFPIPIDLFDKLKK
jgi:hypothetical protein